MHPKEETRFTSVPLSILLPLSYRSTFHCMICETEMGSLIISSLPWGTVLFLWIESSGETINKGGRGSFLLVPVCSPLRLLQRVKALQHPALAALCFLQPRDSVAQMSSATCSSCRAQLATSTGDQQPQSLQQYLNLSHRNEGWWVLFLESSIIPPVVMTTPSICHSYIL